MKLTSKSLEKHKSVPYFMSSVALDREMQIFLISSIVIVISGGLFQLPLTATIGDGLAFYNYQAGIQS
jgi:hypothetical protein